MVQHEGDETDKSKQPHQRMQRSGSSTAVQRQVLELLIWFGFLGVRASGMGAERYSYDMPSNMRRLLYPLQSDDAILVVHPAFRAALHIG